VHGCSDCDEADIEEWIQLDYDDQGYWLLNDEKIIAAVENDNNSNENNNDEVESTINVPSHGEIHTMLVKCLPWVEQQQEVTASNICVVNNLAATKGIPV